MLWEDEMSGKTRMLSRVRSSLIIVMHPFYLIQERIEVLFLLHLHLYLT
jgi:hypothetical protein